MFNLLKIIVLVSWYHRSVKILSVKTWTLNACATT